MAFGSQMSELLLFLFILSIFSKRVLKENYNFENKKYFPGKYLNEK